MVTIDIPSDYGYVMLTCGLLPSVTFLVMAGKVMKARKDCDVPYPNLYATPGYHKKADEFNRVQRGHQHMIEQISDFRMASFIGGLKYPITCSVMGVAYCLGSFLYMKGYSDKTLDVKTARMKKGGPLASLALLISIGCGVSSTFSFIGWL